MNPALSTIKLLPAFERIVASRFFSRYVILAIVLVFLFIIYQKNKAK